jgi:predicted phage-related endonuclease
MEKASPIIAVMDAKSARRLTEDNGWTAAADGIPEHYAAQLLWQCAALGVEDAHLAAYGTQYDEWRTYRLSISEAHQRAVIAAVADWRERHLLGEVPPPIDGSDAWNRHLGAKFRGSSSVTRIEAAAEDVALARDLARVRKQIAGLSQDADLLTQKLKARLGDNHLLTTGGEVLASWKPRKGSARMDAAALRAAHPDIAEKFTVRGEDSRTFKLNIEEEEE